LSEQTTTKTLLPTVLLLLPSFQAYNFNILFNTIYNLDDYNLLVHFNTGSQHQSFTVPSHGVMHVAYGMGALACGIQLNSRFVIAKD
jgi:hypothetical protein